MMTRAELEQLAEDVADRLTAAGVGSLHVGALAFPGYTPADYELDDLLLIVKEADLASADAAMTVLPAAPHAVLPAVPHPCTRVTWGGAGPVAGGGVVPASPATPDLAYSNLDYDDPVWVQIYTTQRHGPLLLVDLEQPAHPADSWFDASNRVGVAGMPAGHFRPSDERLLLWQASQVTNAASDCSGSRSIQREVDKLHRIATRPGLNWATVVAMARAYDTQYLAGIQRNRARITAYAAQRGVAPGRLIATPPANVRGADLDYGVLYDLRYALEALDAWYPGTVPAAQLPHVQVGTGTRPRKIWDDAGDFRTVSFSIHDQVMSPTYGGGNAAALFAPGLAGAGPVIGGGQHGYW